MRTNNKPRKTDFIFDVTKKSYTIIDNWLFDLSLTEHEKLVFIVLKRYASQPGRVFPAHATIAKSASVSTRTVKRALKGLQEKGLITIRSQANLGRSNIYLLGEPDQLDSLKLLDGVTDGHTEGRTESHRGRTESHRGRTESHRGRTESHRGRTESPTINTNTITNTNTNTTAKPLLLCFTCKKTSDRPAIQLDFENIEHEVCQFCGSKLIVHLSEIPLEAENTARKADKLLSFLKRETPEKLFLAIDLIRFQYHGQKIKEYQRLLLGMLRKDLIMPEGYVPYHERKLKAAKRKKAAIAKRAAEAQKENEEAAYFREAEKRLAALPKDEYDALVSTVTAALPPMLRTIQGAVRAAIIHRIMEGEG